MSDQETRLTKIEQAIEDIGESLRALTRLEERHAETREALGRAFKSIEKIDGRVVTIEGEMPTLKLARTAMFGTIGLVALGVAGAIIKLVVG